ncbi:MAG: VCBS repeat-containing protein, partial [Saprospiraceae bacterium]|nr:VCBS repeat-containing protein [Saprospiraceae bacterium]
GQGAFTEDTRSEFEGLYQGEIEFGDVDNDGDQDVVIMGKRSIPSRFNTAGTIAMLYLNDGTGLFTLSEHQPFPSGVDGPIVFRDADGDGDQDILNRGRLLLNDGAGKFRSSRASDHRWGGPHQFLDADKDGDLDIVINGGDRTSAKILINNQIPGHFAIVENAPFPKLSFATIAISDVNEDQHPDVLLTGLGGYGYAQKTHGETGKPTTMLYINNGNGGYQEKPGLPFEQVFKGATTFADVNGDQRPDLLLTGVTADSETPVAKLYLNSGGGAFAELPNPNLSGIVGGAATFLDIDADGDQDLVLEGADKWGSGAQQVRRVYSNDGSGRFSLIANPSTFLGKEAGKGVFGDVTGDGKEDFLRIGKNPKLFRNDGGGNFSDLQSATFQDLGEIKSAAFADVDGDGDQDALISIHSGTEPEEGTAKLYLNDGQGAFTEVAETPFAGISAQRLEFGDYNGDGDTDLVIFGSRKVPGPNDYAEKTSVYSFPHGPKFSSFIRLYFNDGNGSFTEDGGTPLISMPESAAAFTDLDNDGDTDILQVGRTPNNLGGLTDRRAILYLNNTIKP